jgi:rhodanese-related sulfurtransferase
MIFKFFMKDGIPTLKPNDLLGLDDVSLIDVRMPEEYTGELGHIEGTKLITLGPDLDLFFETTDKETQIVFICRSSVRSGKACEAALKLGFKNVFNLEGGMIEWNKLDLPRVR